METTHTPAGTVPSTGAKFRLVPAPDGTVATVRSAAFAVTIDVVTAIDAPASVVWSVLVDIDRYGDWNPQITSFKGRLAVGERLDVTLQLPGRSPHGMRPRLIRFEPGDSGTSSPDTPRQRSFEWRGTLGVPGLLDGRHSFTVTPTGPSSCRFEHHERLSGALIPLVRRMLTVDTPAAFIGMNRALAARATEAPMRA